MSNGQRCCLARVCCPPLEQIKKLAALFVGWAVAPAIAEACAKNLLAEVDLAPLGTTEAVKASWTKTDAELGAAVRIVYGPAFTEAAKHGALPSLDRGGAA